MDEQQLIDRLDARVADVPVGAPPIDAMRASVRRRRSRTAVLASAAAVAVIAAGSVVWQIADSPDPQPPVASDPPADPDVPPAGHRYVGIGTAVIAVPEAWGTNETECGTPQEDTVVIDQGEICMALVPRPADVDSVQITSSPMPESADIWSPTEVDGVRALRSPIMSTRSGSLDAATETGPSESSMSVYLPSQHVLFTAASSSADAESVVTELLGSIAILQDHTTVPGFQDTAFERGPRNPMVLAYTTRLEVQGLSIEVVEEQSELDEGTVLTTDPAVGSVVSPGDTVTVTVAR